MNIILNFLVVRVSVFGLFPTDMAASRLSSCLRIMMSMSLWCSVVYRQITTVDANAKITIATPVNLRPSAIKINWERKHLSA